MCCAGQPGAQADDCGHHAGWLCWVLGGALWHHWVVCVGFQYWGVEGGGQVDLGDGELSCHVQF